VDIKLNCVENEHPMAGLRNLDVDDDVASKRGRREIWRDGDFVPPGDSKAR
jgi:hypothetical protein